MKSKPISNRWLIAKLALMLVMTALAHVTFAKPETKTVSTPSAEKPVMPLEDATLEEAGEPAQWVAFVAWLREDNPALTESEVAVKLAAFKHHLVLL